MTSGDGEDSPFPEPVEIPIGDSIDLHYFRPSETASVVEAYVEAACEADLHRVRIIHGRGRGVQRAQVRALLERNPHVERFADAPGDLGSWGTTIVWLRRS